MEFDPTRLGERELYKLMTGAIVPRPIALVTTLGPAGPNAAPFSLFNMVGTAPPMIVFSVGAQDDGSEKDTLRNVRWLPEFVVHLVDEAIAAQMNVCATNFPTGVSELAEAGFTSLPSVKVKPPRIAESPVQMECRVAQVLGLGQRHHLVLGEVVWLHFRDGLVDERFHVDIERLRPIGRLSGSRYARLRDFFELERRYLRSG